MATSHGCPANTLVRISATLESSDARPTKGSSGIRRSCTHPPRSCPRRRRPRTNTSVTVQAALNSLYPALRRFEEAGAATKTAEPQEGLLLRLVYALTAVGHELLHDMLAEQPPAEQAG